MAGGERGRTVLIGAATLGVLIAALCLLAPLALATFIIGGMIGFFICAALTLAHQADEAVQHWPDDLPDTDRFGFPRIGAQGFNAHFPAEISTTVQSASPAEPPVPGRDGSRGRG